MKPCQGKCRWFAIIMLLIVAVPASALEISIPSNAYGAPEVSRTSSQKNIGISTDVLLVAMPVATLAGVVIAQDWEGLKQGALTAATTAGATLLLKYATHVLRPDHSNYQSFPSGHCATTFATAAFLQRRYGWKFGAPAYALAFYTGVGRVLAKKHHWWDCVAGAAIGAGSAYIYTRPWARRHSFALMPCATDQTVGFIAQMQF